MAIRSSHKAQHFIPRSYLSGWCDQATPAGMQPYVWTFEPSGGAGRKRAPGNLFSETDIYTLRMPDGTRDLRIEHHLSKLEQGWKGIVRDYVAQKRQLPQPLQTRLVAFIAAMHGRTPLVREIQRTLWQDELKLAEQQEGTRAKMSLDGLEHNAEDTQSLPAARTKLDALRKAVDSPMQFLLPLAFNEGFPMLQQMTMTIICTDEPGFITSDSPVTWFDPTVPKDKFLTHKSSLFDEGIQVTMPLSPRHMILMHHPMTSVVKPVRYVKGDEPTVAALNRRTAHYADKTIVSWRDGFDPRWRIVP